ncbi:MAG: MFS transporter [Actinobacteria bacterium]|nr:MFS transporter [Actinomycetota bacterium]
MFRKPSATAVYLMMMAVTGFAFAMMGTIFSVYQIIEARLDPLELVLMGTVLEGTVLVFEVPTGIVADSISRRTSIIVGMSIMGAGFVLMSTTTSFVVLAASQAIWGLGYTFTSGADVAWITDEVGEQEAARLYLRGSQWAQFAALFGIAGSIGLAVIALGLPLLVAGLLHVALAVVLILVMPERAFRRPEKASVRHSVGSTVRDSLGAVKRRPVLLLIFAVAAIHGASTEGFDRLSYALLIRDVTLPSLAGLDPLVWFGVIGAGGLLLGMGGAELVKRGVDITTHRGASRTLLLLDAGLTLSVVLFALTVGFLPAIALIWAEGLFREVRDPVFAAWVNQGLDSRSRATVNSMGSQVDALGQVGVGPLIGLLAVARSVQVAIVAAGLLRLPALALYSKTLGSGRAQAVEEEADRPLGVDDLGIDLPGAPNPPRISEPD